MELNSYQHHALGTRLFKIKAGDEIQKAELTRHYLLSGLTSQVGEIASRLKKKLRDGEDYGLLSTEIGERIGYSLWYLAVLADEFGLHLDDLAERNIAFNERRWHQHIGEELRLFKASDVSVNFDRQYPETQRLPERMVVEFRSEPVDGIKSTSVWMYPDWPDTSSKVQFGDTIDDNSNVEDHYRYHDIFHFSYVAFLSWSPVVRGLLKRKRRVPRAVDRVQDGARARDTEEAATAFIYSYVHQQNYLRTSSNIDTGVLTTIRTLLRHYEVGICAEKDWERAIIKAAEVLRKLIANDGGWVIADRVEQELSYMATPPSATGASK